MPGSRAKAEGETMSMLRHQADATGDLREFVLACAPMPAPEAAWFGSLLAEHLAWLHADGRRVGPFDSAVRVRDVDGRAVPVIEATAPPGAWDGGVGDIQAVGELLVGLLGVSTLPAQGGDLPAGGPPEALWSVVLGCLDVDPGRRPAAAVLARQLRYVGRYLLLGLAPWPPVAGRPAEAAIDAEVPTPSDGPDAPADPDADRRRPIVALVAALPVTPPQWEGWWRSHEPVTG
jgi:hypothetical protein